MSPNLWRPDCALYVRHEPSGRLARVVAVRTLVDGSRVFQFASVIKHAGATVYWGSSEDCTL